MPSNVVFWIYSGLTRSAYPKIRVRLLLDLLGPEYFRTVFYSSQILTILNLEMASWRHQNVFIMFIFNELFLTVYYKKKTVFFSTQKNFSVNIQAKHWVKVFSETLWHNVP